MRGRTALSLRRAGRPAGERARHPRKKEEPDGQEEGTKEAPPPPAANRSLETNTRHAEEIEPCATRPPDRSATRRSTR